MLKPSEYARFSGLVFQMMATIGVAVWLGWQADHYLGNRIPVVMVVFSLMSILGVLYSVISQLNNMNKE